MGVGPEVADALSLGSPHHHRPGPLLVEGHGEAVIPRADLERLTVKTRLAEASVRGFAAQGGRPDETAVLAMLREQSAEELDEDTASFVRAFIAGWSP